MDDVTAKLQQMIQSHVAMTWDAEGLGHQVPLGQGGLGMDSVAIVTLLLQCESQWGVPFPAELLEPQPLTLGRLVDHVRSQVGA